ncbi:MAG TPA: M15 family metallopeptidase [Rhodanobacteraceae bacterium]
MHATKTALAAPTPPRRCRDAAERDALLRRARAAGIPPDYGSTHALRRQREPQRLTCIGCDIYQRVQWLQPAAARAFQRLQAAASTTGVDLQVVSAFRSIAYQLGIIERKLASGQHIDTILRVSAAPGYSEHHSGRCVDLATPGFPVLEEAFERSPAFAWLTREAAAFGFALSYPRGNRHHIGYEPWHWCWHAR